MILNMKLTHEWCWICQTCQNATNQFILADIVPWVRVSVPKREFPQVQGLETVSTYLPSHQCWRFLWVESLPPRCSMGKYDIVRWSKAVFFINCHNQRQYDSNANRISLKISSLSFFGCFLHWRRRFGWYSFMSITDFFRESRIISIKLQLLSQQKNTILGTITYPLRFGTRQSMMFLFPGWDMYPFQPTQIPVK